MENLGLLVCIAVSFGIGLLCGAIWIHMINWKNERDILSELDKKNQIINEYYLDKDE